MMAGFDPHSVCACCLNKKKGQDPCVEKPDSDCNALTPDQLAQLSTPSYKLKKKKREAKSSSTAKEPSTDTVSPTLVALALVSVVGVIVGQSTSRSPGLSAPPAEKKRKAKGKKSTSSKSVKPDKAVKSSSSRSLASTSTDQEKPASSQPLTSFSTDSRFTELDMKWSDRFNRLEALIMAKILDRPQDPTFSTVKVSPTHTLPANVDYLPTSLFSSPTDLLLICQLPTLPSTGLLPSLLLMQLRPLNRPANRPPRDTVPVLLILPGRTLLLQVIQTQIASLPTGHQWTYMWKSVNCPTSKRLPSPTLTNPSLRNSHTLKR